MNKDILSNRDVFGSKTILLPENKSSDCYAVYSKEEFSSDCNKRLLVNGKAYKHRLYFYKKLNNTSEKTLTFILLNSGTTTHLKSDAIVKKCEQIADDKYGEIEILSIFTLRTIDKIDSVSEDAILDVIRMDLSKNDIVLAYGDDLKRTTKYKNISLKDLQSINKVRRYKIMELLKFLSNMQNKKGKIYIIGLTQSGYPKPVTSYKGKDLVEFIF